MKKKPSKRNPIAKVLSSPLFRKRIVEVKKGLYKRTELKKEIRDIKDAY